jgi:hypothetical protein
MRALEPPYGGIWNRLRTGDVAPFLGAGASFVGRTPGVEWRPEDPICLPSGLELAHFLADEAEFPATEPQERDDLAKVSSYYADILGRRVLRKRLRDILLRPYHTGPLHELLAEIPAPMVIVVTNYDTLVEQAFRAARKPYDLVTYPADQRATDIAGSLLWWPHGAAQPEAKEAKYLDIDFTKTTVIFKMHGSIAESAKWDGFVITEEDYVEFLSRMMDQQGNPCALD